MRFDTPRLVARDRMIDGYRVRYDDKTSVRMGSIRQNDTAPELAVRRLLAFLGLRYRVRNRDLPGSPDIANRKDAWAIFVHGCYWHRHSGCCRTTTPKRNTRFWTAKFSRNVTRDRRRLKELRDAGFTVMIIWECQTKDFKTLERIIMAFAGKIIAA